MIDNNSILEIDFWDFCKYLYKKKVFIILATCIVSVLFSFCSLFFVKTEYKATSKIFVERKSSDYLAIVTSEPVLKMVIDSLGLNYSLDEVENQIDALSVSDRLIEFTVIGTDALETQRIADAAASKSVQYIKEALGEQDTSILLSGQKEGKKTEISKKKVIIGGFLLGISISGIYLLGAFLRKKNTITLSAINSMEIELLGTVPFCNGIRWGTAAKKKRIRNRR